MQLKSTGFGCGQEAKPTTRPCLFRLRAPEPSGFLATPRSGVRLAEGTYISKCLERCGTSDNFDLSVTTLTQHPKSGN